MRFSKIINVVCALAVVFASLPVVTAAGLSAEYILTDTDANATTSHPVDQSQAAAVANAQAQTNRSAPTKKRPNLFVRLVTAPFRGLARLFGGRRDTAAQTAREPVKANPPAATTAIIPANADSTTQTSTIATAASPVEQSAPQQQQQTQPVRISITGEAAASMRAGATTRSASTVSASSVATTLSSRAGETTAVALAATTTIVEPRPFTPIIEGIGGDPLSQGRALLESGHLNEAISELSVAAVAGPDLVEANNLLGLAYDRRGEHKQAQEFYERAISVAPQNARVLNNLGHSFYLDDRYQAALARLKVAARLAPADKEVANNLALVYGRLGKYNDTFKQFKRAGGEFYASMQTAELLAKAGRDRDAIKYYEAARQLNPASSEVLRQLITLYVRTGQREKAEAAERALDLTPTDKGASASS